MAATPGTGKKAISTRISNLMRTGMTEDEARVEVSRQMREIGSIGGTRSRGGGFAHPNSDASAAGRKGGLVSKRRPSNER